MHTALGSSRLETKSGNEKKKEVIGNRYAMGTMMMKNSLQYILPTRNGPSTLLFSMHALDFEFPLRGGMKVLSF